MNCESLPLEDTAPCNSFARADWKLALSENAALLREAPVCASLLPQGQTATLDCARGSRSGCAGLYYRYSLENQ